MNLHGKGGVRDGQGMPLSHSGHLEQPDVGETKVKMLKKTYKTY